MLLLKVQFQKFLKPRPCSNKHFGKCVYTSDAKPCPTILKRRGLINIRLPDQ